MIKGLLDYLTGRAPLKRALQDKEKVIETYLDIRNCQTTENNFLKKEKDVLTDEKNKQYQTIQDLLTEGQMFKDQISHLAEKTIRLEISLEAEKQRADGLLKEVESWKAAALRNDETAKALNEAKEALKEADQKKKRKTTPPGRVTGKGKGIKSTGATGEGVKLNKQ